MGVYSITVHDFSHLLEQGVARAWLFFPTAVILGLDCPWSLVSDLHPASQPDRLEIALELARNLLSRLIEWGRSLANFQAVFRQSDGPPRPLDWKLAKPHGGRSEHLSLAPVCLTRNNAHASTDPKLLARNTELQVFRPPANKISFHYARSKSCCTIE